MSEYTKQAEDFLTKHNIDLEVMPIGKDCPPFCEGKDHIHGYHYKMTFSRPGEKSVSFDFWNSYNDTLRKAFSIEKDWFVIAKTYMVQCDLYEAKNPTAHDILACVQKYDVGTFEDFCGEYGYDTDSRKALSTYLAVEDEYKKVRGFFTPDEIEEMQEIN